jgi:hypothetical protein
LFKYTDEEGNNFYLPEKKTGTLKSPFSGKSFPAKPEKSSISDVSKGLKEDDKKATLFKYVDGEGNPFYLESKEVGSLKSPYTGKTFKAVADKESLSEVGQSLKTAAVKVAHAEGFLHQGMQHPAMNQIQASLAAMEQELVRAQKLAMQSDKSDAPNLLQPVVKEMGKLAAQVEAIYSQMKERLGVS